MRWSQRSRTQFRQAAKRALCLFVAPSISRSFVLPLSASAPMKELLARLRSFRSPRSSLLFLLFGLAVSALARTQLAQGGPARVAAVVSLDSAIAAAVLFAEADTTADSAERLRRLVSQKRDVQVEAQRAVQHWLLWSLGGSALVVAGTVTGSIALVGHLRGGASRDASTAR